MGRDLAVDEPQWAAVSTAGGRDKSRGEARVTIQVKRAHEGCVHNNIRHREAARKIPKSEARLNSPQSKAMRLET